MSFVKYPKNWRANGYGWHNQEILNNLSQNGPGGIVAPPAVQTKSQYPQQQQNYAPQPQSVPAAPYGYPPATPSLYPTMPALPSATNGS